MVGGVQDKKIIGVIPARFNSSRLPGKPLLDIYGKPMIYWVAKRVEASILKEYYVATDDIRILEICNDYSIPCVMTSEDCLNGTERIAEVSKNINADYYVNIQGDEPCINVEAINKLVLSINNYQDVDYLQAISKLTDTKKILDHSHVKVSISDNKKILYFSRLPIPYLRDQDSSVDFCHYRCMGLYLYHKDLLSRYVEMSPTKLENIEHIEQLRLIENNITIYAVEVDDDGISVDTPEDIKIIREQYIKFFK